MNLEQLKVLRRFANQASGSLGTMETKMRRESIGQDSLPQTIIDDMTGELFGKIQDALEQMDEIDHLLDSLTIELS